MPPNVEADSRSKPAWRIDLNPPASESWIQSWRSRELEVPLQLILFSEVLQRTNEIQASMFHRSRSTLITLVPVICKNPWTGNQPDKDSQYNNSSPTNTNNTANYPAECGGRRYGGNGEWKQQCLFSVHRDVACWPAHKEAGLCPEVE